MSTGASSHLRDPASCFQQGQRNPPLRIGAKRVSGASVNELKWASNVAGEQLDRARLTTRAFTLVDIQIRVFQTILLRSGIGGRLCIGQRKWRVFPV